MAIVISKQRLDAFLFDCGVTCASMDDARYALPTEKWFFGRGADAVRRKVKKDVGDYSRGDGDCDDFTECAATEFHRLHRKTASRPRGTALAVARFKYVSETEAKKPKGFQAGHAIVCAVVSSASGQSLKLVFLEPQGCVRKHLTREEIERCAGCQFS